MSTDGATTVQFDLIAGHGQLCNNAVLAGPKEIADWLRWSTELPYWLLRIFHQKPLGLYLLRCESTYGPVGYGRLIVSHNVRVLSYTRLCSWSSELPFCVTAVGGAAVGVTEVADTEVWSADTTGDVT